MMKNIVIFLFLLHYYSLCEETINIVLPQSINSDVETKQFNNNSLWGYLNGGADLYLEYGFNELKVFSFDYNKEKIKVEIFQMQTNESSFGIYSVNHFNCLNMKPVTEYFCSNNYNVQFVKGNYYISIINETGDKETYDFCIDLAKKLIPQFNFSDLVFPKLLYKKNFQQISDRIRLFKGQLGFQNINSSLSELLKLDCKYSAFISELNAAEGYSDFILFKFNTLNDLNNFINNNEIILSEEKKLFFDDENLYLYSKSIGNLEMIMLISNNISNLKAFYEKYLGDD
jgi:hypothetical protein